MTDEEKLFNVLMDTRTMLVTRQKMHEEAAKRSGASGKRSNGQRAQECATILGEIGKIIKEYELK